MASSTASRSESQSPSRRQSRIAVEIWPWLVGIVGVMLIPEIALRRVGTGALGWLTRRFGRRDDRAGTNGEGGR